MPLMMKSFRATKKETDAKTFMLVPLGMNFTAIHTKVEVSLIARYEGIPNSANPTSIDGV